MQKKITPWRLGIQEQEPELQLAPQQRAARLGKAHGALLVVASLIDKPTNLGGQRSGAGRGGGGWARYWMTDIMLDYVTPNSLYLENVFFDIP